jgi:small subunit ribosomal protein S8
MESFLASPRQVGRGFMDKIADFITQIRNAGTARHEKVDVPASNVRAGIAKILVEEGYIRSFKVAKDSKQGIMRVYLKYDENGKHAVENITRASRPGRRLFVPVSKIPAVRSGLGLTIISTSQGIMSGKKAAQVGIGGELLCTVW